MISLFSSSDIKQYFFKLLNDYLSENFNSNEYNFLKLYYEILNCKKCRSSLEKRLVPFKNNFNSNVMIILDPYFFYKEYIRDDRKNIDELFLKILNAVNLSPSKSYISFPIKCEFRNNFEKSCFPECEKFFLKEIELLNPEFILVFGKHSIAYLFDELQDVEINRASQEYFFKKKRIFFTNHPVEMFYNPSLKKPAWNYLKYFMSCIKK